MNLIQRSETDPRPLACILQRGGLNTLVFLVAHIFKHQDGVVLARAYWGDEESGHPFHVMEGELSGDGPTWRCGPAVFREIDHGDELAAEYNRYMEFINMQEAERQNREACKRVLRDIGFL